MPFHLSSPQARTSADCGPRTVLVGRPWERLSLPVVCEAPVSTDVPTGVVASTTTSDLLLPTPTGTGVLASVAGRPSQRPSPDAGELTAAAGGLKWMIDRLLKQADKTIDAEKQAKEAWKAYAESLEGQIAGDSPEIERPAE